MPMINQKTMHILFKPKTIKNKTIDDLLVATGISLKELVKINVQGECSKAIDETCINTECPYNLLKMHENELYQEVLKEVQQERKEVEERTRRDYERIYGKPYVP